MKKINDKNPNHINMKKIVLILATSLIWNLSIGQTKSIKEFQEKYRDFGSYFSLRIDGGILKGLSKLETNNEEAEELVNIVVLVKA